MKDLTLVFFLVFLFAEAMEEAQRIYGVRDDLQLCGTRQAALKGADALVICTEWKQFWAPDFELMAELLNEPGTSAI